MKKAFCALTIIAFVAAGCAARPEQRPLYKEGLPPLEEGWSRVYISAGSMSGVKLWSVHQVGPVYINDQQVGSTAKNEHFVVDLMPGTYEAHCTPEEPYKNYVEKREFTFEAGEVRYLSCDQASKGVGMAFGLIGALLSEYVTKSYLKEKDSIDSSSKLVSYRKLE